jgi:hypothetical protein
MGTILMAKTLDYIELSSGYVVFMVILRGNVGIVNAEDLSLKMRTFKPKASVWL